MKGTQCDGNGECRSFNCVSGFCLPGKEKLGGKCVNDEQCYDGRCGPEGTCVGLKSDGAMPPDAGKPDRSVPDTAVPDAARPDLAKPDLAKPDVAKPDAPLLDAPVPDKTPLDAPIPDQTPPDAPLPDQTPPDQLQPDASLCGNGTLDPTELCDGALLGGQTCATQGFTGGKLACEKFQLDTELCYELRDPANLKVGAHATMHALWPQAASDGNGFMVIWQGGSPGGGGFGTSTWIDATLVNAKGKSSASFHVVDTAVGKHHPDLEFGVKDYLVAWDQGTSIRGTTVTPSGKVANPVVTTLTSAYYGVTLPSLAFDGSNFPRAAT